MNALFTLTRMETTLLLRNPNALFMAIGFPAVLLLMQGFVIPGTREPLTGVSDPLLDQLRVIDLFVPIALTIALGSVALTNFPSAIGGYREQGVLRRLGSTPIGPHRVLAAQLIVSAVSLAAGAVVATGAAMGLLGARAPQSVLLVIVTFCLAAVTMLSIGSIIAARASTAQNANGLGMLVFIGSLFTAGVWTPGPLMSEPLRHLAGFTPLGAAAQSLSAAWYGQPFPMIQVLVLIAWTLPCAYLAYRTFRWR
ncbi:MAG TPA: ABC transporter permease [Enteractinococcus sp.]